MERPDVVALRIQFLRNIKKLRDAVYTIVYTDETYVHSSHSVAKAWQPEGTGLNVPFSKGWRMIVVHAGSDKGFVYAPSWFMMQICPRERNKEMNFDYFIKWLQNQVIPNLLEKPALVPDNAAYHNVQVDKCPTQSTRKADIQAWLQRHNIQFTDTMIKAKLLELCKMHKPAPVYRVDQILKSAGHTAIRLPPYHADLNPI